MKFRALSYNIHKGLSWNNSTHTLHDLKPFLKSLDLDFVFLQEVVGKNIHLPKKFSTWVDNQHEFLADSIWSDYAYSKNAVYDGRHHGNAILSKYPIIKTNVIDLTIHAKEMRALLHCRIQHSEGQIDLFCTHLNLLHRHRVEQYDILNHKIKELSQGNPIILAGDFNDWFKKANHYIHNLDFPSQGKNNKTFPHRFPISALDHFFTKKVDIKNFEVINPKDAFSDHLPILLEGTCFGE